MQRKIRMGMVGGGSGAFIGAIHRMAAQLDGQVELVCGAFSSDPKRSEESGRALFIPADRAYQDYREMLTKEAELPIGERMDFVAIVTPNHLHFEVADMALEMGFHVLCDKPATRTLEEVLALRETLAKTNCLYGVTHTYVGYPLVRQAKHLVDTGALGRVKKVVVEYSQGWLSSQESEAGKQASWRLDPKYAGASCCMGDIGVHAAHLAEFITGQPIVELCAELDPVVEGRVLDDDGAVFLRFANAAKGVLMASQISVGEENNLRIRVYGDQASLDWSQQQPNDLWSTLR